MHDQSSVQGQPADNREMIPGQCDLQHRRLPNRGVGPHGHGQQIKADWSTKTMVRFSSAAFF